MPDFSGLIPFIIAVVVITAVVAFVAGALIY